MSVNQVASILAGFKAGQISERAAKAALKELGFDDDILTSLVSTGVGIAAGAFIGDTIGDLIGGFFGDDE